jgi:hypothetical protein
MELLLVEFLDFENLALSHDFFSFCDFFCYFWISYFFPLSFRFLFCFLVEIVFLAYLKLCKPLRRLLFLEKIKFTNLNLHLESL